MIKPAKNSLDLGILVGDIDRSLNFYHHILGLEFVGQTPVWYGMIHRLRFGNSDIKLVDPNEKISNGPRGLEKQLGYRYITLVVSNLAELCEHLQKQEITFALTLTETRPGVKVAMVEDPDGNIVEFLLFTES